MPGSKPHDAIVPSDNGDEIEFDGVFHSRGRRDSNGSAGLKGWFANNAANLSAIVLFMFVFTWLVNDMREAAKANSLRIDMLLSKSDDRESRAWEQRSKDRESALKHGDESVRQVTAAVTAQTVEIGKMTRAIEDLVKANKQP